MAFMSAPDSGNVKLDATHILFQKGPWREVVKGYRENANGKVIEATRVFDIPWDIRDWWTAQCLGWVDIDEVDHQDAAANPQGNDSPQIAIQRHLPWQHPIKPYLYATQCTLLDGQGLPGFDFNYTQPIIGYYNASETGVPTERLPDTGLKPFNPLPAGYARLAVTYRQLPYDVLSDAALDAQGDPRSPELARYVTRHPGFSVENLRVEGQTLVFGDGTKITDYSYRIYPTILYTYIWHMVPAVPRSGILECLGRINTNTWDPQFNALAPGTCMCLAPEVSDPYRWLDGRKLYDVTLKVAWRPDGWNNFFNKLSNKFEPVVNFFSHDPPFKSVFFQDLVTLWLSDFDGIP